MAGESVVWAQAPDEDSGEETGPESEAHGDVDETFAARRLRRWLKGMFGGKPAGPVEGDPGEPGGSPGENH
jgi:hypothetical protein